MSAENVKIGQIPGGKSKKLYKAYWNPDTKKVFVEHQGGFFSSSTMVDTKNICSSATMAVHAAEAYLYNK
jgi:hypothetical protein